MKNSEACLSPTFSPLFDSHISGGPPGLARMLGQIFSISFKHFGNSCFSSYLFLLPGAHIINYLIGHQTECLNIFKIL